MGVIVVFLLVMYIVHICLTSKEKRMMSEAGYVNLISAGDYNLNVSIYGNEDSEYTIVAISGLGVNDYSVMIRNITNSVAKEHRIVCIDRAGYGMSDDTKIPQTTQRIVEDYRSILKKLNLKGKYILMPHSLGGAYATYWESMYPDEIAAVFFIDASPLKSEETFEDWEVSGLWDKIKVIGCKLGLQRPFYNFFFMPSAAVEDDMQMEYSKALNIHSGCTNAFLSESDLINENCKTAYQSIVMNDIPKVYINASYSFTAYEQVKEYFDYANKKMTTNGKDAPFQFEEEKFNQIADNYIKECAKFNETNTYPYLKKLGNCKIVNIPGDHFIYEHKPEEVVAALQKFLEKERI